VRLMNRLGNPDYGRYFCSPECKKIDKRERRHARLAEFSGKKCPTAGEARPETINSDGVCRVTAP
jgi:hypothetical protein